ncbi:MAG: hypothetical protein M3R47_12405 [Chloroflexota bacterium]|nr:hypothetical protein [Chloroflexota bacterium]
MPADNPHIFNFNPANNYSSATTLQLDNCPIKHFLLKLDVAVINGQTITNANLCLYDTGGATGDGDFKESFPAFLS